MRPCARTGPENGWADLNALADEGYDIFTGYNYHGYPRKGTESIQAFQTMMNGHEEIWNAFARKKTRPYIPAITAGWDPRPWQPPERANDPSSYWVYYPDRTPKLVHDFTATPSNGSSRIRKPRQRKSSS